MAVKLYWIPDIAADLAIMARPRGGDWLEDEVASIKSQGVSVVASLLTNAEESELSLTNERALCESQSIHFRKFAIEDRQVPFDQTAWNLFVDDLVAMAGEGKSLAVHCRMGIGRSALLAVSIMSKLGISADEGLKRVALSRMCEVPDTPEQAEWLRQMYN